MLLKIQFLTHYQGGTSQDPKVRERMAWAETEVDIDRIPAGYMELSFLEGRGERGNFDADRVFSFNGKYWAVAEATNTTDLHRMNRTYMLEYRTPSRNGLRNFDTDGQREFSWRAFEYRMMPRQPAKGFRAAEPYNFRNYRPEKVEWNDTDIIERRVKSYYADNLMVAGDTMYCRIEPPCIADPRPPVRDLFPQLERRVFTPYGGFGDLLIDYEKAYRAACTVDRPEELVHARKEMPPFFDPIPGYEFDPIARGVRALFLDVFALDPWIVARAKSPKNAESLKALRALWQTNLPYLSDTALDEAAEIMLGVADDDGKRAILRQWLDRPILL